MATYAGGGGEVPDALRAWVNARSSEAAREIFHRHETALRSPEARQWIEATVAGTQDPRNRRIASARFTLLGRSLEQGVDVALAGLPRLHDLVRDFLEADSYNRQKLMVLDEPALLTEDAAVLLSFLIVIQDDEDTEQYMLESWRILEEARTDVDAAFAGRIQEERGVIPPDVIERYMQEPDPAKQERILRAYPLLRSMVTHLAADPEEPQLGRQFDDLMRRLEDEP